MIMNTNLFVHCIEKNSTNTQNTYNSYAYLHTQISSHLRLQKQELNLIVIHKNLRPSHI